MSPAVRRSVWQDALRCSKMLPRWPQDGPKMGPRWPQMTPRWPQDGPKMAHDNPDGARSQVLRQMHKIQCFTMFYGLRWLHDSYKIAQDGPNRPQHSPGWPKMAPRCPKIGRKKGVCIAISLEIGLGAILEQFWYHLGDLGTILEPFRDDF